MAGRATNDGITVVVDARNVMRSRWPNLTEDRVVDLTRAWADRHDADALIVFDGEPAGFGRGVSELDERTRVIGTAGVSADDWIAEQAELLAAEGGRLWLVTSDRELRGRVEPFVERTIGGGSFAGKLVELADELGR